MMDSSIATTLLPNQLMMYNQMRDKNKERLEGWRVKAVDKMPDLTKLSGEIITGSFTYTSIKQRRKWFHKPNCLYIEGLWATPPGIARDYLGLKYPERRIKCTSEQWLNCVQDKGVPPLYCKPTQLEEGIYLDLSAAYWNITRSVGWDVDYNPNGWIGSNSDLLDFPYASDKLIRNCLVSVGLPGSMSVWVGDDYEQRKVPNRFINLILWRLVMDVLNGIAYDMLSIGAVYVYTDGYILPQSSEKQAFEILESWGLPGRIKHYGRVEILAPNAYAFENDQEGRFETKPYRYNRISKTINKVTNPGVKWLRGEFQMLAHAENEDWLFLEKGE